jgi:hypothetical protein
VLRASTLEANRERKAVITDSTDSTDEEKKGIPVEAGRRETGTPCVLSSPRYLLFSFLLLICEICAICDPLLFGGHRRETGVAEVQRCRLPFLAGSRVRRRAPLNWREGHERRFV